MTLIYDCLNNQKQESKETIFERNCLRFKITNKEKEIIALLDKGYTQKQISGKLYNSASTVNTHIRNIYTKVNANNTVQMLKKIFTKIQNAARE
jgi:DNA-binding NarL/FixJ family response regulator